MEKYIIISGSSEEMLRVYAFSDMIELSKIDDAIKEKFDKICDIMDEIP